MKIKSLHDLDRVLCPEKCLRDGPRGTVHIMRSREDGARCILRKFTGTADVYKKLQALSCENLPRIYWVHHENPETYVLEEYIPGDNLAFVLEGGVLTETQCSQVALQLCNALVTLNSVSVIHRDIKPENVILSGDRAVLIDFDASRLYKAESNTDTQILGTTGYAAPEQYGFSQTDPRTDLYAMGVLMNVLLTGKHPSAALAGGRLCPVIEKCIEVNADKRFADPAQLASAIKRCMKGRKKTPLLIAAVVFALYLSLVLWRVIPSEKPADLPEPEVSAQPTPEVETAAPQLVDLQPGQWSGPYGDDGTPIADPMPFSYDLDGDGVEEDYIFGTALYNDNLQDVLVIGDEVRIKENASVVRVPVPCVFRVEEEGTFTPEAAFSKLLRNVELKVWRGTNLTAPAPEITAFECDWAGGLRILYSCEHAGAWVYEAGAELGEITLRSVTKTILIADY